jgi:5-methyltetrahydropteroyltriglutamate--homocysteine methyltransferase
MLKTTIVGSLPRPAWLATPGSFHAEWRLEGQALHDAQDDAVRLGLLDQEEAGLDVVCDGELRRIHYIWGFFDGLTGIDMTSLGTKQARGGRYAKQTPVARITGAVSRPAPVFLDALRFTKAHTDRPVKVTLPGPMTICDSTADEHYGLPEADLAMHFAAILNDEALALAEAGADVIQFDEPCFNIYTDKVRDWGMATLERAMRGVSAKKAVHICYGYGTSTVLAWKNNNTDWGHYSVTLPLLAKSSVDQISVECAASGVDPAVLASAGDKEIMLGVIDVGAEEAEAPELVASRIREALPYVSPDRLLPCTDCGMMPRSPAAGRAKLRSLVAGAAIVRKELGAG